MFKCAVKAPLLNVIRKYQAITIVCANIDCTHNIATMWVQIRGGIIMLTTMNADVRSRVSADLKHEAAEVLQGCGLNVSSASKSFKSRSYLSRSNVIHPQK